MKAFLSVLSLAALSAAVFISCNKETATAPGDVPVSGTGMLAKEFSAGTPSTRATLKDFPLVEWQNTDAIAIWDGFSSCIFTVKAGTNQGTTATFEGSVAEEATSFHALFPASAFNAFDGQSFTATLASVQTVSPGACNAAGATLAVGSIESGNHISFKNAVGLLKITIGSEFDSQIHSVTLSGKNGEAVAGKAVFNCSTGQLERVVSAQSSVTIDAGTGRCFTSGDYYIAVLPVSFNNGFELSFKNLSGTAKEVSTSKSMTVPRGGGYALGDVTAGIGEFSNLICTAEELMEWNANAVFNPGEVYKLGADIDMSGKDWTPRSDFQGTFDGQGHKIYNFQVTTSEYTGFIRTTKDGGTACIKNLIIGSKDGTTWDGVSKIVHSSSSNNYTWYYAGVVAKTMGQTNLENIINFASVEVAEGSTGKTRIAGICGNIASTGTIKNCINYGSITNNASVTGVESSSSSTLQPSSMAGIAAQCDKAATYDGCINYGTITNSNPGVFRIGGIVGNTSYAYMIKDCKNYGEIKLNATCSSANSYIGGILGYGNGINVKNCANYASFNWNTFNNTTFGGGVFAYVGSGSAEGCLNEGTLTVGKGGTYANWSSFGGVAASIYTNTTMSGCTNKGKVSVYFEQTVRVGGLCGTLNNGCTLKDSVNDAEVSCDVEVENSRWVCTGGVCAFQEKGSGNVIQGCTNNKAVTLTGNYTPTSGTVHAIGANAGGILGYGCLSLTVKDNVNKGSVSATNESTTGFNAGGIIGQAAIGAGITSSGNENEAAVSASTSDNVNPCAGGVIGRATVESYSANADKNTGAVSCGNPANAGSVAGFSAATLTNCGAGGSVCGVTLDSSNFTSYVQGSASTGTHSGSTFYSK